jgi:hypothetical protein
MVSVNTKKAGDETLDYSLIDWKSLMYYDETSPTFLRWKVFNGSRNPKTRRGVGDPVSTLRRVGGKLLHGQIQIKRNHYAIHRVVWILVNGSIPKGQVVNHIDNDPSNNNISNLELCSRSENGLRTYLHTTGLNSNSSTGYLGVLLLQNNKKNYKRIEARCRLSSGKIITKSFNLSKLSYECAITLALGWQKEMKDLHGIPQTR